MYTHFVDMCITMSSSITLIATTAETETRCSGLRSKYVLIVVRPRYYGGRRHLQVLSGFI